MENCFCGSELMFSECCGLFLNGLQNPPIAQMLMRSRYSAYVLQNADYILATWHKSTRPKHIDFSNENIVWQKLEILKAKKGNAKDDKGYVEFNAFYEQDGQMFVMHEISRFKKFGGKWFYVDGEVKL
jgi:SEC-C motif-containing protein